MVKVASEKWVFLVQGWKGSMISDNRGFPKVRDTFCWGGGVGSNNQREFGVHTRVPPFMETSNSRRLDERHFYGGPNRC